MQARPIQIASNRVRVLVGSTQPDSGSNFSSSHVAVLLARGRAFLIHKACPLIVFVSHTILISIAGSLFQLSPSAPCSTALPLNSTPAWVHPSVQTPSYNASPTTKRLHSLLVANSIAPLYTAFVQASPMSYRRFAVALSSSCIYGPTS